MQPEMGAVVAGKYVLTRQLGAGGMGSVWQADDMQSQRPVAIKFMTGEWASSDLAKVRFEREALAASQTKHPYIIDVKTYGIDGDTPFIVMELLEGEDLYARLRRAGPMPLITAAKLLNQVAAGLNEAHRKGVIHRDLKPGNIFMARTGAVEIPKIVDFGLAKATHTGHDGDTTAPGTILGSLYYISPEQLKSSKDVDHRSDLWSLGVIMFRLITGEIPFKGGEQVELITNICQGPIPVPSELAPELGLPVELDAFFRRAFSRDKTQRFQTALEMAEQFTRIVQGLPEIPRDNTEPLNAEREPRSKRRAVVTAELEQAALNLSPALRKRGQAPSEETTPMEISEGQMLQVVYRGSARAPDVGSSHGAGLGRAAPQALKARTEEVSAIPVESDPGRTEFDSEELLSTNLKIDVELSSTFVEAEARRKEATKALGNPIDQPELGGSPRKARRPLTLLIVIVAALLIGMVAVWSYQTHQDGARSPEIDNRVAP